MVPEASEYGPRPPHQPLQLSLQPLLATAFFSLLNEPYAL